MNPKMSSFAILSLILSLAACQGPTGLLPGESLDGMGEVVEAPADWSFAGEAGGVKLETNPSEPYSVNLAYTVLQGRLYINAGGTETQWAKNIAADSRVRLLLDQRLYELDARRVVERTEVEAFAEAWTGQSFFRRDPLQYEEVWLYELAAR